MLGPFSIWDHPLANDKESFYFVGHVFGIVSPLLYRICLPLKLRRPAVVFEGCASYLCAPWVPMLVRRLHRRRRPPVLVVMLREPVAQNLSWWRLEQAGMAWGSAMGLGDEYSVRGATYPPPTLREAAALSRSPEVAAQWRVGAASALARCCRRGRRPSPRGSSAPSMRWAASSIDPALAGAHARRHLRLRHARRALVVARSVLQRIADAVARSAPSAVTKSSRRSCARRPTRRPRRRRRASTTRRRSLGRRSNPMRRRCASSRATVRATSAYSSCSGGTWAGTMTRGTSTTGSASSSIISLR